MTRVRTILVALVATALVADAGVREAAAQCPPLDGFGGSAGFGAGVLARGDDDPSELVDVSAAFPTGLGFFGATFSDVYININGNITLGEASSIFTPFPFPSESGVRRIAIFFSDVDTRNPKGIDNNIYYHVDASGRRLIVTWLTVERFPVDASQGVDTFQMVLTARPDLGPGDFDVEYRYHVVDWINSGSSPPAQIGFDAGDGVAFASHPASMTAAIADLETTPSNHPSDCTTGSFAYYIRGSCGNDQVDAAAQEECDPLGTHPGCSSLCTVTAGYACTHVDGLPSTCAAGCGNGLFDAAVEECDDGNNDPGDGCSPICRVEPGATCDTGVQPSDCNNTCATDDDCEGAAFCGDNLRCQPARPVAQVCSRDAMCASGACADGVCCAGACDAGCGTCAASGSVGTCTALADGAAGAGCGGFLCDGASLGCPTSCGGDGDCAAASHCAGGVCVADLAPGQGCDRAAACASGVCVDGVCCAGSCEGACERCDLEGSAGACTPLPLGTIEAACGVFVCDGVGGACPATCTSDDGCVADHFCDGQGACRPDLGAGAACGRDAQCGARVCSAGVCCATACDEACETCVAEPGTCTPLADGAAAAACGAMLCDGVGGACPATCAGDADCAASHFCDGQGACLPDVGAGEACGRDAVCAAGTSCVDGVCCTSACGGACERCDLPSHEGACTPVGDGTFVVACGAYACDGVGSACPTTCAGDGDCLAAFFCDAGLCRPDGGPSAPCAHDGQCGAGTTCVDDVCCTSACAGACERCDLEGSAGACAPLNDGTLVAACGAYACDGAGGACPTTCVGDGDCAADHFCAAGACVPDVAAGAACERTAQCAAGACTDDVCCTAPCDGPCGRCGFNGTAGCGLFGDGTFVAACGAYACDGTTAACPTTCVGDGDCAADHYCDGQGACQPDRAAGDGCARGAECPTGVCVDGVCCDGACDGACVACDLAGARGTCSPVPDGAIDNACGGTLCDGVTRGCPTTCAGDGDCTFSHYCGGGACVVDQPPGGACDRKAQCGEGQCVDQVCCFTACDGACDRCDLTPGTCAPVADGTFVAACGAYACDGVGGGCPTTCASDGDCAADHFCDGQGACRPDLAPGGACDRVGQCASGFCADGVCCGAACDGGCDRCDRTAGTCLPVGDGEAGQGCGPYLCGGVAACPTTCGGDADCAGDHFCEAGTCLPDRATGQACDRVGQCASGHCADGVCCGAACDGACDRCDTTPGACLPVQDGTLVAACDPYLCGGGAGCPTTCASDADCADDHYCDAGGACAPDAAPGVACDDGAMCATGTCSDGVCCDWPCEGACERCDLAASAGTCTLLADGVFAGACGAYACDGATGACPTECASDGDCAADHFCDGQGACRPDLGRGVACGRVAQCASGQCADGVCCDTACGGACDRCDLAGAAGDCKSVPDGTAAPACGAYLCGGEPGCPTGCAGDGDCAAEHVCEAQVCVPLADDGAACARDATCASGVCAGKVCCDVVCDGPCEACDLDGTSWQCTPRAVGAVVAACGDYRCDGQAGACPEACEVDAQCGPGTWCGDEACHAVLIDDSACTRDAQCASGFCDAARCMTLAIDLPLDGAITRDATPEIRGRAPPGARVTLKIGGVEVEAVADEDGQWSVTPASPLPEGPVTITASLGAVQVEIDIVIDTVAPAVVILSPQPDTIRPEPSVTISGTTEPDLHVIVTLGALARETDASATGAWGVGFEALVDGPHTATATAIDLAGNEGTASVAFRVDSLAPTITITEPIEGALSNVASVTLRGRGKPSSDLTLSHDGQTLTGEVDEAGDWAIALGVVADGTWTDVVTITDQAAREANDEVTYTIDTIPPALVISSPEEGARVVDPTTAVMGTSEPGAVVEVRLDGEVIATLEIGADGAWTASPPEGLTEGAHTASVSARDRAGNTTELTRGFTLGGGTVHLVGGSSCAVGGGGLVAAGLALLALALARRLRRGGAR